MKTTFLALTATAFLAIANLAHAQSIVTNQGGSDGDCLTTNLPAKQWTLVAGDVAANPCTSAFSQGQQSILNCNPKAPWFSTVHGDVEFQQTKFKPNATIEMQVYVGSLSNGECQILDGMPTCPTNGPTLVKDQTYALSRETKAIPFVTIRKLLDPTGEDAFYVYVKPSVNALCVENGTVPEQHN